MKKLVLVVMIAFGVTCIFAVARAIDTASEAPLDRLERAILQLPEHQARYRDPVTDTLPETAERLTLACRRLGVTILAEPADVGNAGQIAFDGREMQLAPGLSPDELAMTMGHELAHLLQPPSLTGFEKEMFAEAVAYLVVLREADKTETFARYMAQGKMALPVLHVYRTEIEFAALVIGGTN